MRSEVVARRGSALFAAVVLTALLGLSAAAFAGAVVAQVRSATLRRAATAARTMGQSAADSLVAAVSDSSCARTAGSLSAVSALLPGAPGSVVWTRAPQPDGRCWWEVRAEVRRADGVPIAAHRAVRRTSVP